MLARLIEIPQSELHPTLRALSDAGATTADADWIRKPGNAALIVAFIHEQRGLANKNPHELTVEETILAFRRAVTEEGWDVPEEVFNRLTETAPAWPEGRDAFRSLRIRFGEGSDGVQKTFEAHVARIRRVHGEKKFWRWELLLSGQHPYQGESVERLRLLNDNQTHKPVVDWVIIDDLSANRQRESITAVRGQSSLADEGLVIAWLFPGRVEAITYEGDGTCAWFLGGYELNVPEDDGESWQYVPCVYRYLGTGRCCLCAGWRGGDDSGYSVPAFRES